MNVLILIQDGDAINNRTMIKEIQDRRNLIQHQDKDEMIKNCFWIPEKTPENKSAIDNKPKE